MIEKGIDSKELEKLLESDILIRTKKLKLLSDSLEKILISFKEVGNLVNKIRIYKEQYKVQYKLFNTQLNLIENDEIFDKDKIKQIEHDSRLHTKMKLIQDYKQIETIYNQFSEYYNAIDRDYYNEIMNTIMEEMF